MSKAKKDGKPFFVWHNPTRMHVFTFLSPKYKALMSSETNYGLEDAGMTQLDDIVGSIMKHLEDIGEADNTILVFTTDNGTETFTWPDGGNTPFKGQKGTIYEGGFRAPAIARWPGKIKPGSVENGIFSALDWFPTFVATAGDPDITNKLLKGVKVGDRTYKNHLDGYNQLDLRPGLHDGFLCPRVLAVRSRPGPGGGTRQDRHRLPTDAGPGLLHPGRGEEADRGGDQGTRRPIVDAVMIACGLRIHVLPSKHDEVYRLFRGLLEPARVRGGCQACRVYQDLEDPEVLALVQEWASWSCWKCPPTGLRSGSTRSRRERGSSG
jgi:hypothetical protein